MLPYTPLHYLLFTDPDTPGMVFDMPPLVMTSGNLSEEPICTQNDEARERLSQLADVFLMHDRDIHTRCDDSVVRLFPWLRSETSKKQPPVYPIRRSRGYAPDSLLLPWAVNPLLATGAELKNTFCLARQNYAFISHHIGDLENHETLQSFEQGIDHFERLFRIRPEAIAYDYHPDYLSSRYAQARAQRDQLPLIGVQHHHAHIAACMAEHGLDGSQAVIGVALDGTGYGEDGAVWGGEFLVADYLSCTRAAHLVYTPLPGGDQAVRQPWRMALSWLQTANIPWDEDLAPVQYARQVSETGIDVLGVVKHQLISGVNAPLTSSVGRLFDAAAALLGVHQVVNYEAQAAIELEAMVAGQEMGYYEMSLQDGLIDPSEMLAQIIADLRGGEDRRRIAARFHGGVAQMVRHTCKEISRQTGIHQVALSGGVWQNAFLLAQTVGLLHAEGLTVLVHRQVPANDGGLSLGQALVGAARLQAGKLSQD
jgi:hydrogenase maturation protein HypF